MANQQVIISVLADVSKFSNRMRGLGSRFAGFARTAVAATLLVGAALGKMAYDTLKSAEAAKVADQRLNNIAKSMGLFGDQAGAVSKRLQDYASKQQFATGVDDESIKATQAKLLTFKELAKTAGALGGAFDRATMAAIDLAAAGFGDAESNATQLGKALQDPINGLTALKRVGVTFTEAEKKKIKALVESGKLLEAQDVLLKAIETQVGGTAEATVTASQKMSLVFGEISEKLGTALLPYITKVADAFVAWLQDDETVAFFENVTKGIDNFISGMQDAFNDPAVKETFDRLNNGIQKFFEFLASPAGKKAARKFAGDIAAAFAALNETLMFTLFGINAVMSAIQGNWGALNMTFQQFKNKYFPKYSAFGNLENAPAGTSVWGSMPSTSGGNSSAPGGARGATYVSVTGITPSATIGRTVLEAVNTANRLGVR